ncbi:MAG: hypothetical protein LBB94_03915 [Clostridiales bacterium]|jgi:hypothetical protein|nr:hypothetical protein [Clostridiales bacterium]
MSALLDSGYFDDILAAVGSNAAEAQEYARKIKAALAADKYDKKAMAKLLAELDRAVVVTVEDHGETIFTASRRCRDDIGSKDDAASEALNIAYDFLEERDLELTEEGFRRKGNVFTGCVA